MAGAVRKSAGINVSFQPGHYYEQAAQKRAIAQKAYTYIQDEDTIMLGDSTTCLYLAQCIQENTEKRVSVITNSLCAAAMLVSCDHVTLFDAPAEKCSPIPPICWTGSQQHRYADIVSTRRSSGQRDQSESRPHRSNGAPQLEVKREVLACADHTFVLADSSKFGSKDLFMVCSVDEIYSIITDDGIDASYLKEAEKMNVQIVVA